MTQIKNRYPSLPNRLKLLENRNFALSPVSLKGQWVELTRVKEILAVVVIQLLSCPTL